MTQYKKALLVIVTALPLGSALAASATPASARDAGPFNSRGTWRVRGRRDHRKYRGPRRLLSRLFKWLLRKRLLPSRRILCPGLHPQLLFGAARHL